MVELLNIDCMEYMATCKDKQFDLAIVDPPYGINGHKQRVFNDGKLWDLERPTTEYFVELKRISKNQIVWGGNYFSELWPCKGFVVWDKHQPEGISFAMIELATTTFDIPAKLYFTKPAGERGFYTVDSKRIHPTQKPIALYKWLLKTFVKDNDKIIDTHLGSGSSAIACYDFGCDFVGCEIDEDYYRDARKRFENHKLQGKLF